MTDAVDNPPTVRPAMPLATYVMAGFGLIATAGAFLLAFGFLGDVPTDVADGFFVIDSTARLFALLINTIFLGVAVYVWTRVYSDASLAADIGRYAAVAILFIWASNLAVFCGHLIGFWIFLEITTLAAVPLIQHRGGTKESRAAWRYFLFSCVGLGLALLGIACLTRSAEQGSAEELSLTFEALARAASAPPDVWRRLGLGLFFLGLGTKLGLAPMYAWLPDAYDAAPPATTALLAAVQFNVALVGVLRVLGAMRNSDPSMFSFELIGLGIATMAISALNVITTRNAKKLIAYASMNHGGVIAIGLGIGPDAAYGVVLYVVSNALIKAILFLTAGRIRSHYGTEDMTRISGVIKDLPHTGVFFMVGTFALLGLPPFGSFVGELVILSALMRTGFAAVFIAFCFILTITFVATGRSMFPMIWGEPKHPARWGRQPLAPMLPKLAFLAGLIALGLHVPAPLNALFRDVASSFGGLR